MGSGQSTQAASIISIISSSSLCYLLMMLVFAGFLLKTASTTIAENPQLLALAAG